LTLLTFKESSAPPEEIEHHFLTTPHAQHIAKGQTALVAAVILREDILELLGSESTFCVVGHSVAAVFVFVDLVEVDAEEWIWKPAGNGRVAEVEVDNVCCQRGEQGVPA